MLLLYGMLILSLGCTNKEKISQSAAPRQTPTYWIKALDLKQHPEGGYYRRTYASELTVSDAELPQEYTGNRFMGTAIYFLLDRTDFSAFHKLKQDEMWHFYEGKTLHLHSIDSLGKYSLVKLGRNPEKGEVLQYLVPGGTYFGSEVSDKTGFSLVGCTVTPGFDFDDFEMPSATKLKALYPQHATLIHRLTRTPKGL